MVNVPVIVVIVLIFVFILTIILIAVLSPCTFISCQKGFKCVEGSCVSDSPVDPCQNVSCQTGFSCVNGVCVSRCQDVKCPDNLDCVNGSCIDLCTTNQITCPTGQKCVKGSCVDACLGVTCQPGFKCKNGNCVSLCQDVVCPGNLDCINGYCVDLCVANKINCPSGQKCVRGACVDACFDINCPQGTQCQDGKCVDPGPSCKSDWECKQKNFNNICQNGVCVFDMSCVGIACCPNNQVEGCNKTCIRGVCQDIPPCFNYTCPKGQICVPQDGKSTCVDICKGVACNPNEKCILGKCYSCINDVCQKIVVSLQSYKTNKFLAYGTSKDASGNTLTSLNFFSNPDSNQTWSFDSQIDSNGNVLLVNFKPTNLPNNADFNCIYGGLCTIQFNSILKLAPIYLETNADQTYSLYTFETDANGNVVNRNTKYYLVFDSLAEYYNENNQIENSITTSLTNSDKNKFYVFNS